jgi:hypothetical protein
MGVRAVIVVRDDSGDERQFRSGWASKQLQIPHLARFVHTADRDGSALSVAGYLDYVATHPHTLPSHDITDDSRYRRPDAVGDLDHRYELLLRQSGRTFRYLVYDRSRDTRAWQCSEDLATRTELYEAAARMCRDLAANTQRQRDANHGLTPPGWPSPQAWQRAARLFLRWRDTTGSDLRNRPGPAREPTPQWYAVHTARTQSRRINTRLRQHYPGVNIRTRVSADGVIRLTIPAELATDAEAARIAEHVGDLCGRTFTTAVRTHRPSRYSVHNGQTPPHAQVNATLTLRPEVNAIEPDGAPDTAPGTAQRRAKGSRAGD